MKRILFILCIFSSYTFGQINSTQNGDWYNPTTWDCFCIPNPLGTDDIIVSHAVIVNGNGVYVSTGSLTITSSGSVVQALDESILFDGGQMNNAGILNMRRVAFTGGTHLNTGSFLNLDSLWVTNALFSNSGLITTYDFLNDIGGETVNTGHIDMTHQFMNQGFFDNQINGTLSTEDDYSNWNLIGGSAYFNNDGLVEIGHNFINESGDTIAGSGQYIVCNLSTNNGGFVGSFSFLSPSGGVNVQNGTIEPGITFSTVTTECSASIEDDEVFDLKVIPNPCDGEFSIVTSFLSDFEYCLYSFDGRLVRSGYTFNNSVKLRKLTRGTYYLLVTSSKIGSINFKVIVR
ncbi:MAG: T9SS type A sorting domain-containing protein [Bacteroidetes bacterium]|nr:MAG: T9SS type A sorting domain-containing protein [Bacteroidota bacterium]TNE98649.1 MAG: T9SS type A sorting domain-containing protein [Bacteroidota bacterium]